jgi:hypothetical protein
VLLVTCILFPVDKRLEETHSRGKKSVRYERHVYAAPIVLFMLDSFSICTEQVRVFSFSEKYLDFFTEKEPRHQIEGLKLKGVEVKKIRRCHRIRSHHS